MQIDVCHVEGVGCVGGVSCGRCGRYVLWEVCPVGCVGGVSCGLCGRCVLWEVCPVRGVGKKCVNPLSTDSLQLCATLFPFVSSLH